MLALSRPAFQLLEKTEEPKGDCVEDNKLGRCGMEPARIRDNKEDFPMAEAPLFDLRMPIDDAVRGLNGLVEGVGSCEVFMGMLC